MVHNFDNNKKQIIEMIGINKTFPGLKAVDNVNFTLHTGQIHAIVGENGAGKTTLMRILAGILRKDSGIIRINGTEININDPSDAKEYGILMVEQELSLFPELNIYQNLFLGNEFSRKIKFLIDWGKIYQKAKEILLEMGLNIDLKTQVKRLKTSEQQLIEISKAIFFKGKFIIMDEPTSSLGEAEKENLFSIIKKLKNSGLGIIYISHRMREIFDIADFVTVMRDGKKIGTYDINNIDEDKLVKLMVGRELLDIFYREREGTRIGKTVLEVKNITKVGAFKNISFKVREGEVLGLAGLRGSQRSEIMKSIFGLDKFDYGDVFLDGEKVRFSNAKQAVSSGIGMIPEDRKSEGIIGTMSVKENLTIALLKKISKFGWISEKKDKEAAMSQVIALNIKLVSLNQPVTKLSGGNQQKVALGRFLVNDFRLLILDEPTRGIDVGAKAEVRSIISNIVKCGVAVIMISSELPEVLGLCDRILVLHEGRITDEYDHKDATQEKIMASSLK